MDIAEYEMLFLINQSSLVVGFLSPKHEDNTFSVPRYRPNHLLCEVFPAFLLVRVGSTLSHGKDGVEQEDTLLGPSS